jgi:DNA-binding transcriptional MocR family regulator
MALYEQLADRMAQHIRDRVLKPGERLPSVRKASRSSRVSPSTVIQAYALLEEGGFIEARPRSGYYVRATHFRHPPEPELSKPSKKTVTVDVSELVFSVLDSTRDRGIVPFGSAFPSPLLFPFDKLARGLASSMRRIDPWSTVTSLPSGHEELRRLIALRYANDGMNIGAREVVVTSGALEALNLCLQAVTRPGDIVAIESPAFYAALQAIERLGLKALEIPTHPQCGVSLPGLEQALQNANVKACWLMTNFQNPLGSLMPDGNKAKLVELLARYNVPLIEDDVYGELYFGERKPLPAKAFDREGLIMHCSSFSKCLAPGYRVGWVAAGRFAEKVERLKLMTTLSASIPPQAAIAEFIQHGGYDRHLRKLRRALAAQKDVMIQAIGREFPKGTRITHPQGGYLLWVELPGSINTLEVHRLALERGISVAPGPIFSAKREYTNCLRLNYGHIWSEQAEEAIAILGKIASSPV